MSEYELVSLFINENAFFHAFYGSISFFVFKGIYDASYFFLTGLNDDMKELREENEQLRYILESVTKPVKF